MKTFDPDKYLQRIKHRQEVTLTEAGLRSLLRGQLHTIPFENFDVLLGRPVLLDPGSLFDKLVERPRGDRLLLRFLRGLALRRSFGDAAVDRARPW